MDGSHDTDSGEYYHISGHQLVDGSHDTDSGEYDTYSGDTWHVDILMFQKDSLFTW